MKTNYINTLKQLAITGMFLSILISACTSSSPKAENKTDLATTETKPLEAKPDTTPKANPYLNAKIEVKTFKPDSLGWGYDVYMEGKLYIHQPHIPAINGNRGFRTADDAKKTGEFAAAKIRNNIMPPSLSIMELDSLGVTK